LNSIATLATCGAIALSSSLGVEFVLVEAKQIALAMLGDRGERPIGLGPFTQSFDAGRLKILGADRKHRASPNTVHLSFF
jgi:hypothetical protein